MKFAVVGGDRRSALLCALLSRDGHKVYSFALEKAELPEEVPRAGCLQGCVYGADCVILPVPAEKGGLLNSPLSSETLRMTELIGALWKGQILCGGRFSDASCMAAIKGKLQVEDIMRRPDFAVGNAALTAEGALELMMAESERALWGSRVLVTGWGRIGKILSLRLSALGARVTVAARHSGDRAMAAALGLSALSFGALEGEMGDFDFIVNTVPARVISDAMLCLAPAGTLLLELASPPGGFDRNLAENIGLKTVAAPGLPGKCAPYTAAELLRDTVYDIIKEQEE